MKSKIIFIIFYLVSINLYSNDNFYEQELYLLNKGYIKYDPQEIFYLRIYDDCYYEVFSEEFKFSFTGIKRLELNINDGYIYNLYYALDHIFEKDLPNILTIVYLYEEEKTWGYYKKNILLEGIWIETIYGGILAYY